MQDTVQKDQRNEEIKINTEIRHLLRSWAIIFYGYRL